MRNLHLRMKKAQSGFGLLAFLGILVAGGLGLTFLGGLALLAVLAILKAIFDGLMKGLFR
jgi:hypothetical protein